MAPCGDDGIRAGAGTALVPAGSIPTMPLPEDWGTEAGGGPEALAVMVNMLGMDLERTQEGLGRLVSEADEVLQGVFERLGILHARVSRIETVCGLPPWRPPGEEDEDEEGHEEARPMSARTDESGGCGFGRPEEAPSPRAARRRQKARSCRRGHPLEEDAECPEDAPPRLCSFCKTMKQTTHKCSAGCYFHSCLECALGITAARECQSAEADESEDQRIDPSAAALATVPAAAVSSAGKSRFSSRSPSNASEDGSFCAKFLTPAATPSTTLPDDEVEACCQDIPSFAEDSPHEATQRGRKGAKSPPATDMPQDTRTPAFEARGGAEGSGAKGMKARLCDLEDEVKELARRLAASPGGALGSEASVALGEDLSSSSKALVMEVQAQAESMVNATREECRDVMSQLAEELQNEVQAMTDPKRVFALMRTLEEEGERYSDASTKDRKKGAEPDASLLQRVEKLAASCNESDRENAKKRGELRSAFDILRQDLTGDLEGLRGEIQKLKLNASEASSGALSRSGVGLGGTPRSGALGRSASNLSGGKPPTLEDDLSQSRVRPRTASLSAGKIRRGDKGRGGDLSECLDGDGVQSECLRGVVTALMAIARVVGVMKDEGDKLGEGEWEWSKAGRRLEQAWESRTKELWQIGVKPPTIIDLFRSKSEGGLSRGAASTLPDRRESARLAERLASTLNSSNGFFNGSDSPSSTLRHLSQYTSVQGRDRTDRQQDKPGSRHGATAPAASQNGRAFAGLEALRQMRQKR